MAIKDFYPGTENYKKIIWVNSYSSKLIRLLDINHRSLIKESNNWGSRDHNRLRTLQNKISAKINVLARYSSIITSKALK